jgi:maltose-binding protein MalE
MKYVKAEKKELVDKAITSLYEPLYSRYFFVWKGLMIRPPTTTDEIIAEGHKLHHCIGSGNYIENMAKGNNCILFVRYAKQPDNPFFTMELRNNKVVQCRGKHNCGMTKEVKQFVTKWQIKTGTAQEKHELFF